MAGHTITHWIMNILRLDAKFFKSIAISWKFVLESYSSIYPPLKHPWLGKEK